MKPNEPISLAAKKKKEEKSPYLRSVLSGTSGLNGRVVRMAISDRLAAIRYIKESQWRNGLSRG